MSSFPSKCHRREYSTRANRSYITMEHEREISPDTFTSVRTFSQMGLTSIPKNYILPPPQRPILDQNSSSSMIDLPVIDLSCLENPLHRSHIIEQVQVACKEFGAFQVINHGVPSSFINDALDTAAEFFGLPNEEKMCFASSNVHQPIRYGTSVNHVNDKVKYWRDFIKHYSNPISSWINLWPSNPPSYKNKMGNYAKAVHLLHKELMQLVFESLGIRPDYLQEEIEKGLQIMAINFYPPCPEPNLALGIPPHCDYGFITILCQDYEGLQIMDINEKWLLVPVITEALVVQLGDQMEVLTNGRYKSVLHRVILDRDKKRQSIASIHSLALDEKVKPVQDLVDEKHPLAYTEYSFNDFLHFISDNDIVEGTYMDTLRRTVI